VCRDTKHSVTEFIPFRLQYQILKIAALDFMKTEYSTSPALLRSPKFQMVPVARILKLMPKCCLCDVLECVWDVNSSLLKGQIHQRIHFYPAESGIAFSK